MMMMMVMLHNPKFDVRVGIGVIPQSLCPLGIIVRTRRPSISVCCPFLHNIIEKVLHLYISLDLIAPKQKNKNSL